MTLLFSQGNFEMFFLRNLKFKTLNESGYVNGDLEYNGCAIMKMKF